MGLKRKATFAWPPFRTPRRFAATSVGQRGRPRLAADVHAQRQREDAATRRVVEDRDAQSDSSPPSLAAKKRMRRIEHGDAHRRRGRRAAGRQRQRVASRRRRARRTARCPRRPWRRRSASSRRASLRTCRPARARSCCRRASARMDARSCCAGQPSSPTVSPSAEAAAGIAASASAASRPGRPRRSSDVLVISMSPCDVATGRSASTGGFGIAPSGHEPAPNGAEHASRRWCFAPSRAPMKGVRHGHCRRRSLRRGAPRQRA